MERMDYVMSTTVIDKYRSESDSLCLTNLPVELQLEIMHHLPLESLLACAVVCKTLCLVATGNASVEVISQMFR